MPKCEHMKYAIYSLMMGNIAPLAIFEVKIGNIFIYMMGNSKLKLTFMLYLWAAGKRMTRR